MTIEEIKQFLPSLSDGEAVDLEAAANADSDEGAEWLPYYKMALDRLMQCCAVLHSLAVVDTPKKREMLEYAGKMHYHSLLFCGIGPRTDSELIRRVEQIASKSMADLTECR